VDLLAEELPEPVIAELKGRNVAIGSFAASKDRRTLYRKRQYASR